MQYNKQCERGNEPLYWEFDPMLTYENCFFYVYIDSHSSFSSPSGKNDAAEIDDEQPGPSKANQPERKQRSFEGNTSFKTF